MMDAWCMHGDSISSSEWGRLDGELMRVDE